jgi:hypothetical protein
METLDFPDEASDGGSPTPETLRDLPGIPSTCTALRWQCAVCLEGAEMCSPSNFVAALHPCGHVFHSRWDISSQIGFQFEILKK